MMKTVKAYYWFSQQAADMEDWPSHSTSALYIQGKRYTLVTVQNDGAAGYKFPDKVLVATGPYTTWVTESEQYEEWPSGTP